MTTTAEQCFLSLEGDRVEALAWSAGITPAELETISDLSRGVPAAPAVWRTFVPSPGRFCVSQSVSRLAAPDQGCTHALVMEWRADLDPFALCCHPETFEPFCLTPGPELSARPLPVSSTESDVLRTLRFIADSSRLASLIDAAIQASPGQPLWFEPAGTESPLFWFQALSLCLPPCWRSQITFSTLEAPREGLPYTWIGGSHTGTFKLLETGRPGGPLSRWAKTVVERILEGDLSGAQRIIEAVQDRAGVGRSALLEEAAREMPAPPREALLEAARVARGVSA
ncbi:MAG: GAP1-M domain-containing protein [Candidatus Xenobia bacterium]